ncbi:MAG: tRNA(Met) cytidine acetyltransferase, partial [Alteromonadaceae bacterium]
HRGLMVIDGQWDWCLQQLCLLLGDEVGFWLGERANADFARITVLNNRQTRHKLGQECQVLVINGFSGIDLNGLGALSGTLTSGSLCYLLCPELDSWALLPDPQNQHFSVYPQQTDSQTSRWVRHLTHTIKADKNIIRWSQQSGLTLPPISQHLHTTHFNHPRYKTAQQQVAVEKIKKVALGRRRRPLVLIADRGRGKSSALGLAVAELLLQGKQKVIISAPQVASVAPVFARASEQLTVISQSATKLIASEGSVEFIPPDELIKRQHKADLVMIDEAAAIPAPMLTRLLQQYSRIVFTSTIHGYEGTGRGFEIRFKHTLEQLTPDWQSYQMQQPIRWSAHDPLEQFINQALMLNAQAAQITPADNPQSEPVFALVDRDQLLNQLNGTVLSQVIGLLTLAHYKTTPNDLRHLLDGSNIELYILTIDQAVVGTALLAIEGKFPESLCQQIFTGERRPKGHLLPQTLSCHGGFIDAPAFSYARVTRIAIHPDWQNKGLGSQLLQQLTLGLKTRNIDFIGSSFGATSPLLHFWQQSHMTVVRLGVTVEATSNEYSAVVLRALNDSSQQLLQLMRRKFDDEFPRLLIEFYPLLSTSLVIRLLQQQTTDSQPGFTEAQRFTLAQQSDITAFIHYKREYEFASEALWHFALQAIRANKTHVFDQRQQTLLIDKVLRKCPWPEVVQRLEFTGKKAATEVLKQVFTAIS